MSDKKDDRFFKTPVSRRDAIKTMGTATAAGILGLSLPGRLNAFQGGTRRPNIIFILSDDHRWDLLSCLDHAFIETPNMDRIAEEGVLFENAFVTTSLCSPSRASFITGNYAHTHGVKNNITPWDDKNITFFEYLKDMGYDNAFIGKWHMPGGLPTLPEVDEFITFTAQGGQGKYFNCPLIVNGIEEDSRNPYITTELTDRAIEFLERDHKNPFCLYLSHKAIHHQFLPPKDLKSHYADVKVDFPPEMNPLLLFSTENQMYGTFGTVEMHYKNYCEALYAMDIEIGRVLDRLDDLGIADDTIVIYAGDNGYFWGEHNKIDKRWPYEESMRIPFIVRAPGMIPDPGRRAGQMVLNVDLAPSLIQMVGETIPDHIEGESIVPILRSGSAPGREEWLYEYFKDYPYRVPPNFAVRTKDKKYIEYEGRKGPELFDLTNDPKEMNNLMGTAEGDDILPDMKARLDGLKSGYGIT